MEILNGLNEAQREAVMATEGYVRVIAGAGSGKTKTLVSRYIYLIDELGVSPANILCVTFTNKAAAEMKQRVGRILNDQNIGQFICTYHGFCVKLLREDITKIHYPQSFVIMDQDDQKSVLREVYQELGLKLSDVSYTKMLDGIAQRKAVLPYVSEYIRQTDAEKLQKFEDQSDDLEWKCFIKYLKKQKKGYYLDFNDLMHFALYIMQSCNDVLEKWQNRMDYIMVDETQDNSRIQWRLIELLQGAYKNLFVVGDPDQCIYEWRGAKPNDLIEFDQKYSPCKTIFLSQNYRSTPNILNVANIVIANNKIRVEKELYSTRQQCTNVTHFHGESEQEEGEFIAQTILRRTKAGAKLSDFAVLYRASYLSRFIEQALIRSEIPYVIYGGVRFFERREIKDVLSYLRMTDTADDLSFTRTINLPSRKLGKVFLANLQGVAFAQNVTLYEALRANIEDPRFRKSGARTYLEIIETARQFKAEHSISDLVQHLLDATSLTAEYREEGDDERLENIKELITSIRLYEQENINEPEAGLSNYLQDISLYTNLDKEDSGERVKIMTVHQSKGLEFPVVFVAGMYEGVFPSLRTLRESRAKGLEEERRLAYVAITRAEDQLYLTESEGYNFQNNFAKYPSRFIFEIGKQHLLQEGSLSVELEAHATAYISSLDFKILDIGGSVECGDSVVHKVFGPGEVLEFDCDADSVAVQFDSLERVRHLVLSKFLSQLD